MRIGPDRIVIMSELRTFQGRPDFVVCRKPNTSHGRTTIIAAAHAMTTHTAAAILSAIHKRKNCTLDDLISSVPATERTIKHSLAKMESAGIVTWRDDRVEASSLLRSLSVRLISVEAKQTLSRRAAFQAKQYMSFASKSFIAVWHEGQREDLRDAASNLGVIGVLGVRRNGDVTVARAASSRQPRNLEAYYYALGNVFARRSVRHSGYETP